MMPDAAIGFVFGVLTLAHLYLLLRWALPRVMLSRWLEDYTAKRAQEAIVHANAVRAARRARTKEAELKAGTEDHEVY